MLCGASPRRGWGGASLTEQVCATVRYDRPRPVGVRRCLTRCPGEAGNRRVRRSAQRRADRGRVRYRLRGCAGPLARRARQRLAPTRWTTHPRSGDRVWRWGVGPVL